MVNVIRSEDYEMPSNSNEYTCSVNWKLSRSNSALLIHDMQEYYVRKFRNTRIWSSLIDNIQNMRMICRQKSIPIFYCAQPPSENKQDRGLLLDVWGEGMRGSKEDRQIVSELAPSSNEQFIYKSRYSAFYKTDLEERLRKMGKSQLIIMGVYADIGCLVTAIEAFMRGIKPFFPIDGVAAFSRERHENAVKYLGEYGAYLCNVSNLYSALEGDNQV